MSADRWYTDGGTGMTGHLNRCKTKHTDLKAIQTNIPKKKQI